MEPTHNTFEEMAEAIFAAADADPDFPGIVPLDSPADLLIGYIKAAPRSKRTAADQWSCPIRNIKTPAVGIRPETLRRLQKLNPALRGR